MEYSEVVVKSKRGVWFVYYEENGAKALFVSDDELLARRWAGENGFCKVSYWAFNLSWAEHRTQKYIAPAPNIALDPAFVKGL